MNDLYSNPDNFIENGFYREEEGSADSTRRVFYKKEILIGNTEMYFQIVVTYDLSIYDDSNVAYTDNLYYSHGKTECLLLNDVNQLLFRCSFNFENLDDLKKLERMFS